VRRHSLSYSRAALRDINLIANHLEDAAGSRTAERWVNKFRDHIRGLSSTPQIGQVAEEFGLGRRRLIEPPYIIVYEIGDTTVEVIRVLHGARDLPALFPPTNTD
jgi:toxin ParE1/3/4